MGFLHSLAQHVNLPIADNILYRREMMHKQCYNGFKFRYRVQLSISDASDSASAFDCQITTLNNIRAAEVAQIQVRALFILKFKP